MTITKVMLEYSTGSGIFKAKPSVTLPMEQEWANNAADWVRNNWLKLEAKGYRLTFDGKEGEPLRLSLGKFHVIFRSN